MWNPIQKMLHPNGHSAALPPSVPLRKGAPMVADLAVGKRVRFHKNCPLRPLGGAVGTIISARHYRFGEDALTSYQLQLGRARQYYLTVAEDEQGFYLSISRALDESEQDVWFGKDALSFFTEASSAKSIRCKADLMEEGEWAAARYSKTVDWIEGTVAQVESMRLVRTLHYSLLVNEPGDKALEIEHDDASGENRFLITVYRPIEDIVAVDTPGDEAEPPPALTMVSPAPAQEPPLFREPALSSQPAKPRMDFRRREELTSQEIHIERTVVSLHEAQEVTSDLPSFLLEREEKHISLDQIIPPEAERVRVNIAAAQALIHRAITKNVRVRDVLRDMLGLESAMSDEVIFELPLTDEDYRTLAMRYKLRPDHRVEIRSRLEEELRTKLSGVAKN